MSKPVLVTTAIIVHVPDDDDEGFTFVEPFADRLSEAIQREFRGSPVVEYPAAMCFEWLDSSVVNVGKCVECGCWVSDYTQPEELKGIPSGRSVEGRLICDECETFGDASHLVEGPGDA
jgi:hypothetical protein